MTWHTEVVIHYTTVKPETHLTRKPACTIHRPWSRNSWSVFAASDGYWWLFTWTDYAFIAIAWTWAYELGLIKLFSKVWFERETPMFNIVHIPLPLTCIILGGRISGPRLLLPFIEQCGTPTMPSCTCCLKKALTSTHQARCYVCKAIWFHVKYFISSPAFPPLSFLTSLALLTGFTENLKCTLVSSFFLFSPIVYSSCQAPSICLF